MKKKRKEEERKEERISSVVPLFKPGEDGAEHFAAARGEKKKRGGPG